MIAPPIGVLFPNGRYVVGAIGISLFLLFVILPTPSGFPAVNAGILCATIAAALWANDCLRRLRQWDAGALVPGYGMTAWALAAGIVWCATALASTVSGLAGNAAPAFGIITLAGSALLVCLTYVNKRKTWNAVCSSAPMAVLVALYADHRDMIPWHVVTQPAMQATAFVLAVLAAVTLKRRLDLPSRPAADTVALWRDGYYPHIVGFGYMLGSSPQPRFSETVMIVVTVSISVRAYLTFDDFAGLATLGVALVVLLSALIPLNLLRAAGLWLTTAWRLGNGESRTGLGRMFASRIVAVFLAALGVVAAQVGIHALFGAAMPSRPGLQSYFDEALILWTLGLVVFTWACVGHPRRTTTRPLHVAQLATMCAAFLIVSFSAPTFDTVGRIALILACAASAALAVTVGGRAIARLDFLATTDE